MDHKEQVSIKVRVADRVYPISVGAGEEEMVRHAAGLVSERVRELEDVHTNDRQDALAMCALQYAWDVLEAERKACQQEGDIREKMNELDGMLDGFFAK